MVDHYLTRAEATALGCNPRTLSKAAHDGRVAVRLEGLRPRYRQLDVELLVHVLDLLRPRRAGGRASKSSQSASPANAAGTTAGRGDQLQHEPTNDNARV